MIPDSIFTRFGNCDLTDVELWNEVGMDGTIVSSGTYGMCSTEVSRVYTSPVPHSRYTGHTVSGSSPGAGAISPVPGDGRARPSDASTRRGRFSSSTAAPKSKLTANCNRQEHKMKSSGNFCLFCLTEVEPAANLPQNSSTPTGTFLVCVLQCRSGPDPTIYDWTPIPMFVPTVPDETATSTIRI